MYHVPPANIGAIRVVRPVYKFAGFPIQDTPTIWEIRLAPLPVTLHDLLGGAGAALLSRNRQSLSASPLHLSMRWPLYMSPCIARGTRQYQSWLHRHCEPRQKSKICSKDTTDEKATEPWENWIVISVSKLELLSHGGVACHKQNWKTIWLAQRVTPLQSI